MIGDRGGYPVRDYRVLWMWLVDQLDLELSTSLTPNTTSVLNILHPAVTLVAVNASSMSFSVRVDAAKLSSIGNTSSIHFWREHNFNLNFEFCDLDADLKKVWNIN